MGRFKNMARFQTPSPMLNLIRKNLKYLESLSMDLLLIFISFYFQNSLSLCAQLKMENCILIKQNKHFNLKILLVLIKFLIKVFKIFP